MSPAHTSCALLLAMGAFPLLAAPKPAKPKIRPAIITVPENTEDRKTAQQLHDEALAAFAAGNLDAARAGFQKVLGISPGNVPTLINIALVEQRAHRYNDAEQYLRRILRENQENGAAWLILGIGAYEQGFLDAAHAHLAQAVLYAPKDARARQYLGITLGRRGWFSAAEDELRRAIEIDPKNPDAHYNLAMLYVERVPPAVELARRHYQASLELGAAPDEVLARRIGK